MTTLNLIRRAGAAEIEAIKALVREVVEETYGHLWEAPPYNLDQDDWPQALVAVVGTGLAGVVLTQDAFISDLWVRRPFRSKSVGAALLASAEAEIAARGHRHALLQVIETNRRAVAFYTRHGWHMTKCLPHETLAVNRLTMGKALASLN